MIRTWSNGGGVQSIAGLVLCARGVLDFPVHLFCNVGDDSENASTLDYVRNVAQPYAKKHGIEFVELHRHLKNGDVETILGRINRTKKSTVIPIRRSGGYPLSRDCTYDFKLMVIAKWLKENGATPENPALSAIGYSLDEWSRLRKKSKIPHQALIYPLYEMGIARHNCIKIIEDEGLPIPEKSSCWFCPNTSHSEWVQMSLENPQLFNAACALETQLSEKAGEKLYLHRYRCPLREAVVNQTFYDVDEIGDCSGTCFV